MRILNKRVLRELFDFPTTPEGNDSLILTQLKLELHLINNLNTSQSKVKPFEPLINFCKSLEQYIKSGRYYSPEEIRTIAKGEASTSEGNTKDKKDKAAFPAIIIDKTVNPLVMSVGEYNQILQLAKEFDQSFVTPKFNPHLYDVLVDYLTQVRDALNPRNRFRTSLERLGISQRQNFSYETTSGILNKVFKTLSIVLG